MILARLTARELQDEFAKALRTKNASEAQRIYREYQRRDIWVSQRLYGWYRRVISGQ